MSHDKQFYTTFAVVIIGLGVLAIILYFIAGSLTSEVAEYRPPEMVLENIKPVGQVNIAGEAGAEASAMAAPAAATGDTGQAAVEPMSGEQIYQSSCMACHAAGVAGAPKLGDAGAWAPRIAQGMDTLLAHATNGLNAMPPKGTCMSCSEDDLKAVIQYMVDQSQ